MGIFSLSDYNEDSDNSIYNFIFKFISYVVATQNPINQLSATVQMLLKTQPAQTTHCRGQVHCGELSLTLAHFRKHRYIDVYI